MADFTDDYAIVGSATDYFDCEATTGWTTGGNATGFQTSTEKRQGSNSLELQSDGSGSANWYHDLAVGSRFKITQKDLHFWFKYVKGKGANFLVQDGTAVVIRLFFGGTTIYADYRCTEKGDLELAFGWQVLSCSGNNLRGGSIGGGHNNTTDWDLDIARIELIMNFANSTDAPLNMDCWFAGTTITVTKGTSVAPCSLADIVTYSNSTRVAFPLGLARLKGALFDLRAGLTVGDGLSGVGHEGYLVADSTFIYMHPLSKYVSHDLVIQEYSTFISGKKEVGSSDDYYVSGNQIVSETYELDYGSSLTMAASAYCHLYNSKIYKFTRVELGSTATPSTVVTLFDVDVDAFKKLYIQSLDVTINGLYVHDDVLTAYDPVDGLVVKSSPSSAVNINIYRCYAGMTFDGAYNIQNCTITDIIDAHIALKDTYSASITNSHFDDTKIRRFI